MAAVAAKGPEKRPVRVAVSASADEWASLAISLSKYYGGLDARDFANMAHCRRALSLLERAAMRR